MGARPRLGRRMLRDLQEVERTAHLPQVLTAHLQGARRRGQGPMPQQHLDGAGIDARVEQMGRKAVPQRMEARAVLNLRPPAGVVIDLAGAITRHGLGEASAREQPAGGPEQLPVGSQCRE